MTDNLNQIAFRLIDGFETFCISACGGHPFNIEAVWHEQSEQISFANRLHRLERSKPAIVWPRDRNPTSGLDMADIGRFYIFIRVKESDLARGVYVEDNHAAWKIAFRLENYPVAEPDAVSALNAHPDMAIGLTNQISKL